MSLIVKKFGGTSVATIDKIRNVAKRVKKTRDAGNDIVVVVSAMAGETNKLVSLVNEAASLSGGLPSRREYDMVVSTGEQVTMGLLSIMLNDMGINTVSLTGPQVPIVTDNTHSGARIKEIPAMRLKEEIKKGNVVIVAGFQGKNEKGDITTLGRGGSDTTAVALAAALKADVCDIYTDVNGVYTTDPNICKKAKKIDKISYEEMLEMASLGAKVLQTRSVEFGRKFDVPIQVRSSFSDEEGTMVTREDKDMEEVVVSGVTYTKNEAKISVIEVPDRPGIAAKLFKPLTEEGVNVDMIVQNISHDGTTDMTFTVMEEDFKRGFAKVKEIAKDLEAKDVVGSEGMSKVSIVGAGMRSHAGVASKMFDTLSSEGINIEMISTSEIKISVIINSKDMTKAVKALHTAFGLDKDDVSEE